MGVLHLEQFCGKFLLVQTVAQTLRKYLWNISEIIQIAKWANICSRCIECNTSFKINPWANILVYGFSSSLTFGLWFCMFLTRFIVLPRNSSTSLTIWYRCVTNRLSRARRPFEFRYVRLIYPYVGCLLTSTQR